MAIKFEQVADGTEIEVDFDTETITVDGVDRRLGEDFHPAVESVFERERKGELRQISDEEAC